jgi:hypothetical protein
MIVERFLAAGGGGAGERRFDREALAVGVIAIP